MKIATILAAALLVAATVSSTAQSVGPGPVPVGSAGAKNLGVSVTDPGTGNLEYVLPTQAITGASHTFTASDLYKKTRRSNGGSAMSDTLPASSASGLTNGTRIDIDNVDATATDTLTAGSGTSIASGCSSVGPGRDALLVYDQTTSTWRGDINGCTSLLSANNLSDVANAGSARSNLGVAIGVNVEAWSSNLDAFALKTAPSGAVVGTTDSQVLTNKTVSGSSNTLSNIAASSLAPISANTVIANLTGATASPTATSVSTITSALAIPGYISGLGLSTAGASSSITISAGDATDSTSTTMMNLISALTKTTSSWTAGNNNGCLDTGTIAASSWYAFFEIEDTAGPTIDIVCTKEANATTPAPTLPSGYTLERYIGSWPTNSSSQWVTMSQRCGGSQCKYTWATSPIDINGSSVGTVQGLITLSVPRGIKVDALVRATGIYAGNASLLLSSPDESGLTTVGTQGTPATITIVQGTGGDGSSAAPAPITTNTSGQIDAVASVNSVTYSVATQGWLEYR